MRHYSTNLLTNMKVYWVQAFSIWSLFILIQFELDRIVRSRLNITVTQFWLRSLCQLPGLIVKKIICELTCLGVIYFTQKSDMTISCSQIRCYKPKRSLVNPANTCMLEQVVWVKRALFHHTTWQLLGTQAQHTYP